jgi:Tol biopolymer transport system component/predicted Ser/Thr protein kinase
MALSAGTRLGPYELVAPVGAGGMGEVYRAKDTRLDRTVAVKVLPSHLSSSAESRQRFEREAKTISQLSHPHICALYDVGNQDGVEFLVMEYLEGEALSDRLLKGPLEFEQVLRYGVEIADALDKAHRQGIVHRDLKPGNVMITKSGVKLLDFGLAKAVAPMGKSSGASLTALPTQAGTDLTAEGTILGTFQYMAPEQLEGKEADARTDIFAFGCVLYEMATGQKAFSGKSQASLISSIMGSQPPAVSAVAPMTPPAFDRVVRTCLAKDAEDRWQTAHDVMLELKWVAEGGSAAGLPAPVVAKRRNRERLWIAATVVLAAATVALLALLALRRPEAPTRAVRLSLAQPANAPFESTQSIAVSPDGQRIAFVGVTSEDKRSIWVRDLDTLQPRPLAGTEGAYRPFWSPDGRFLGFFADGKLKKIDASGGPPQVLADAPFGGGGAWNREGVIVFEPNVFESLYRVPATGGAAVPATRLGPREEGHRYPSFLPDGRHFVFLSDARRTEDHRLKVGSLDSPESHDLAGGISNVAFAKPGHLLFVRAGSLLAQPLDVKRLRLAGEPFVLGTSIAETGLPNHEFKFSASDNGVAVMSSVNSSSQLVWLDRSGRRLGSVGDPARRGVLELSPTQDRVAYEQLDADGRNADLWLLDLARAVTTRLTFDPGSDYTPVWSPDGTRITFGATRKDFEDIYLKPAAGGAAEQLLLSSSDDKAPSSWSPDGRFILFENYTAKGIDLWLLPVDEPAKAKPFVQTPFDETRAVFSPDGRRVAYVSEESGRPEITVCGFPDCSNRRQISTGGGTRPRWRADGRELFYAARGGKLMVVDVGSNGEFGAPKELFQVRGAGDYAVARDGQRFLVAVGLEDPTTAPATVVLNWTADLKKR